MHGAMQGYSPSLHDKTLLRNELVTSRAKRELTETKLSLPPVHEIAVMSAEAPSVCCSTIRSELFRWGGDMLDKKKM
jgi:hypothetical protein